MPPSVFHGRGGAAWDALVAHYGFSVRCLLPSFSAERLDVASLSAISRHTLHGSYFVRFKLHRICEYGSPFS